MSKMNMKGSSRHGEAKIAFKNLEFFSLIQGKKVNLFIAQRRLIFNLLWYAFFLSILIVQNQIIYVLEVVTRQFSNVTTKALTAAIGNKLKNAPGQLKRDQASN